MKVLVAVASRHGSTREIAHAIVKELQASGLEAELQEAGRADDVADYGAVILGSALYVGNWQPEAMRFVERHREGLTGKPVWLFSSGPTGNPAETNEARFLPAQLAKLMDATQARGHRLFFGKLDPGVLGLGERLVVKAVRAPQGDFRDWKAIRDWAREIAAALGMTRPDGARGG